MAAEKAPAFQFYPKDFLTDSHVVAMTLQELGAYVRLLCICWLDRSLPAEPACLARLCRVSPACFARLWPALKPCFAELDGRLVQPRMERERAKQESYRAMKAAAGKNGGRPKAEPKQDESTSQPAEKQTPSRTEAKESPPISDLRSAISDLQKEPSSADADFEVFRLAYPANRRVGGKLARAAFSRAVHIEPLPVLLRALEQAKGSEQWQTPKLIPLMTTWLNQERWLQVLPEVAVTTSLEWTCPDNPPCPIGTTAFQCHQRTALLAAKRGAA